MASLALHNQMVSSIVRGFKILRGIEWSAELAEEQLLEARMVLATSLDDDYDPEWAPSPEEIAAACDTLYAGWSDEEREQRRRIEYVPQRLKRYVADFNYQRSKEDGPESGPLARNKRYRERHRELIRAKRQDPAYQEKLREWRRRSREKRQFLIKESVHAIKDQENAKRRVARQSMSAEQRAEISERRRQKYDANREAMAEQKRRWYQANRESFNSHRRALAAQKRARLTATESVG